MKKKLPVNINDKEEWENFTKSLNNIYDKEKDFTKPDVSSSEIRKLDLHGYSLKDANNEVEKFINTSFEKGYRKLLVITGKGLRSKSHINPYVSTKLSVLKNSIPEFINSNKNLSNKIQEMSSAEIKYGGDGALFIYLRIKKL